MINKLINLLFPKACLGCNQPGSFLCSNCFKQIPINQKSILKTSHLDPLTKIIITSEYNHFLTKKLIHTCKYKFIQELIEPLAWLMIKKLKQINLPRKTILIPIPLHQRRLKWRGFNQSQLIAKKISQELNFDLADQIILKQKNTLPQVKLNQPEQRQKNLKQAFKLNFKLIDSKYFQNKTFLLIDDVVTTGTTLQECAKTLKILKPKQIQAAVIAHAE